MAFYGVAAEAATLAGVANVDAIITEQVNAQIDAGIYPPGFGAALSAVEYYDVNKLHQKTIVLKKSPIISISEIINDAQSDNPTTVDSSSYAFNANTGVIYLHNRNDAQLPTTDIVSYFYVGKQSVKVSYTYGYSTVPNIIKQLATLMAARWARFSSEANFVEGQPTLKRLEMADYSESYDVSFLASRQIFDTQIKMLWENAVNLYRPLVLL